MSVVGSSAVSLSGACSMTPRYCGRDSTTEMPRRQVCVMAESVPKSSWVRITCRVSSGSLSRDLKKAYWLGFLDRLEVVADFEMRIITFKR